MVSEEVTKESEENEEDKEILKKALEKRVQNWGLQKEVKEELANKFIDCFYAGFMCYYCEKRRKRRMVQA